MIWVTQISSLVSSEIQCISGLTNMGHVLYKKGSYKQATNASLKYSKYQSTNIIRFMFSDKIQWS